jgi:hypothetical protein
LRIVFSIPWRFRPLNNNCRPTRRKNRHGENYKTDHRRTKEPVLISVF